MSECFSWAGVWRVSWWMLKQTRACLWGPWAPRVLMNAAIEDLPQGGRLDADRMPAAPLRDMLPVPRSHCCTLCGSSCNLSLKSDRSQKCLSHFTWPKTVKPFTIQPIYIYIYRLTFLKRREIKILEENIPGFLYLMQVNGAKCRPRWTFVVKPYVHLIYFPDSDWSFY